MQHGGHYWNQVNGGYAPFISNIGVPSAPHLQNFLLASARYDSGEGGAGKPGTGEVYGGHSHVGTAIYLGDNWPSVYRNHLITHNLHGHQINHIINRREGGGYNSVHAGQDLFLCSDPAFVGVDLAVGPDGAVYMTDWVDTRHCHNPGVEVWDRGNGRVYRMKYDATYRPARCDWWSASDEQLIAALEHSNDWHVRAARLVLASRYASQDKPVAVLNALRRMGESTDESMRLRSIWCLMSLRAVQSEDTDRWLNDTSDVVRSWGVRTLPNASRLAELATGESSLKVKREIALTAGRFQGKDGWKAIEVLCHQPENESDRDLPMILWQAIGKMWEGNETRVLALTSDLSLVTVRDNILWYAARTTTAGREALCGQLSAQVLPSGDFGGDQSTLRRSLEKIGRAHV